MGDASKPTSSSPSGKREEPVHSNYLLRLYVANITPKSQQAILNIKNICETHLEGRYELEVIDVQKNPHTAKEQKIVALPTLIRELPHPLRRLVGDLSDTEKVLYGLDIIDKT